MLVDGEKKVSSLGHKTVTDTQIPRPASEWETLGRVFPSAEPHGTIALWSGTNEAVDAMIMSRKSY